jgi:UDP-glucuronate 4-epimerase
MAHTYSHLFNMPTTGLRFFTAFGPWGRPDMALFLFTKAILEKRPINIFNHGKMMRDFTFIDDIVECVLRVLDKAPSKDVISNEKNSLHNHAPYKIFNVGNSQSVTLMEYIEELERSLNLVADKNYLPLQSGDVCNTAADVSSLENWIDFRPNTSLKHGISKFVEWYREYYKV